MKKQNLLVVFLLFFTFTGIQAQNQCCLQTNLKGISQLEKESGQISPDKMKAILEEEIKLFTEYVNSKFEYPELARDYAMEGEMIVRVVYNKGFENIEIIKSVDPLIDEMVMENILEYIANFDRVYDDAPRLVFELPINFRMEG